MVIIQIMNSLLINLYDLMVIDNLFSARMVVLKFLFSRLEFACEMYVWPRGGRE